MDLKTTTSHFTQGSQATLEWLSQEIAQVRTGRVTSSILEHIAVEHYGTRTPLQGLASISNTDARTLMISPWDPSAISSIKKAIVAAEIGVQPIEDGKVIRLSFPTLTQDMREQTIKMLHKKAEEARIRLRQVRDDCLDMLKQGKQKKVITEDDFYDGREKLNHLIDQANQDIAKLIAKKEQEVSTI